MGKQGIKGNKHKYKGRNDKPSRGRYWANGGPTKRKIRNLMKDRGWTLAQATLHWNAARAGRRMRPRSAQSSLLAGVV